MGRVEAFALPGVYCWFNSDDHEPPHFHAKKAGEWHVKVKFLLPEAEMIERRWSSKSVSGKHQRALIRMAARNRAALLQEWERKVNVDEN